MVKFIYSLGVGSESLPQVKEFKYVGVFFTSVGKMDCEIYRWIIALSAVMQMLNLKLKLSIYQSIYIPILRYRHEY